MLHILSNCNVTPKAQLPVIDEHVQNMLEHDVIEPAASFWCSNVVMVRKQDGTMRLCIDYRKLNVLTTKDKFPLPKMDTCLDKQRGIGSSTSCLEQAAVGLQGSGGTINHVYSAEEMLNEGRIDVLLWYRLVGAYVGLLPGFAVGVSGCAWYGGDGPHLSCRPLSLPVHAVRV